MMVMMRGWMVTCYKRNEQSSHCVRADAGKATGARNCACGGAMAGPCHDRNGYPAMIGFDLLSAAFQFGAPPADQHLLAFLAINISAC